jgi:hypothetical protein
VADGEADEDADGEASAENPGGVCWAGDALPGSAIRGDVDADEWRAELLLLLVVEGA